MGKKIAGVTKFLLVKLGRAKNDLIGTELMCKTELRVGCFAEF